MEITAFSLSAQRSVAVPPGSAVFVRRGAVAWQTRNSDVLMDPNYALLFPDATDPAVLTAGDAQAALTVLRAPELDLGTAPCVRLIDSGSFLEHYRVLWGSQEADASQRAARIIAALLAKAAKKPSTSSTRSPSYGRSMQLYVNASLAQPTSLREMARASALSPFTASRVFHRQTGLPLRVYVRRLRLRTALAEIAANRDLSAIALDLSFFDHAHFTRAFHAEFGLAPSEWRQLAIKACGVAA